MNFFILFIIWNAIICLVYALDKYYAIKKKRRISEKALIMPAYFMGALGAIFGMIIFNHKTSKKKFRFLVPLAMIENVAIIVFLVFITLC